ncbi:helix-turn-helix domain-containing protein [Haloferax sp. KTX1]|uniref:helix-turn-helix domain-containing protein n=1 Tax=Haloferax sp. KTX1 TaxID=2600597 RepID=UPI0021061031|nr:helix-turn-helix domain-containing protein [Haloferax sp. KTX1]
MPTLSDRGDAPSIDDDAPQSFDDFDGLLAATTLLQNPRLAREHVYLCYYGPATIQDLIDELDLARATAYDDVERLERLGVVDRDESTRPHQLTADPFAFVDGREVAITPTLLHAVALTEFDDDAEYFQIGTASGDS